MRPRVLVVYDEPFIVSGSTDYSIPDDLRANGIDERQFFAKPLMDMTLIPETPAALSSGRG